MMSCCWSATTCLACSDCSHVRCNGCMMALLGPTCCAFLSGRCSHGADGTLGTCVCATKTWQECLPVRHRVRLWRRWACPTLSGRLAASAVAGCLLWPLLSCHAVVVMDSGSWRSQQPGGSRPFFSLKALPGRYPGRAALCVYLLPKQLAVPGPPDQGQCGCCSRVVVASLLQAAAAVCSRKEGGCSREVAGGWWLLANQVH